MRKHLHALTKAFHSQLKQIHCGELIRTPKEAPKSTIFPLRTPFPQSLAQHCQDDGFLVRPILYPTVPRGGEMVRVCLHAGNTMQQITELIESVNRWLALLEVKPSRPSLIYSERI